MAGEWLQCREQTNRIRSLTGHGGPVASFAMALVTCALVEFETGHTEEGWSCLREAAQASDTRRAADPLWAARIAQVTGDRSGLGGVAGALAPATPGSEAPIFSYWDGARLVARTLTAVLREDRQTCLVCRRLLLPWKGCFFPTNFVGRSFDSLLGLAAGCIGDHVEAVEHLQDARTFCRRSGMLPELARVHLELAEALLRRGKPGDAAAAASTLAQGRESPGRSA